MYIILLNGVSAIYVWNDLFIMGGEVKAYGGNPGSSWAYANGTNAIECNAIHVSNKNCNFKGVYGEGSKGYSGGKDRDALSSDSHLYIDNTIDLFYGNDLINMNQHVMSPTAKGSTIDSDLISGRYIQIKPKAAP